jgi:MFS family permease
MITEKQIKRSQWMYILEAGFEYLIALLVSGAYLAKITESLGMSDQLTGILSSIISLGHVFQLGSILVRPKRNKGFVIGLSIANQILFTILYIIPLGQGGGAWRSVVFVVAIILAYLLYNIAHPKKIFWLMSLVDDDKRGRFTAVKEIISLIMGMTFTYAMGAVIDHYEAKGDLRTAFIVCAITIVALMVIHTLTMLFSVEKPMPVAEKKSTPFAILKDKTLLKLAVLFALWYVTNYTSTPFLGSYQNKELGFDMTYISILNIVYSVVRIGFSFFWGAYADRRSFKSMLRLCLSAAAVSFAFTVFAVPSNGMVLFMLYRIFEAIAWAGISSAFINLVYDYVAPERRTDAIAVTQVISGVVGFLTTLVMGFLIEHIQQGGNTLFGIPIYSQQVTGLISTVMCVIVILYLQFKIKDRSASYES